MIKGKLRKLVKMELKKMILYPLIVFALALLVLAANYAITGSIVKEGIELKGGSVITLQGVNANPDELANTLKDKTGIDVKVERFTGITGETGIRVYIPAGADVDAVRAVLKELFPTVEPQTVVIGPTFGQMVKEQGIKAITYAFIAMAVVVFLFFRVPVPSLTVVFSALSDMVIAIALMDIFGIELSQATIAALLMLIGYSVDSNILLTTRLLKRKEDTIEDAYYSSLKTGFTMSTTTLGALISLWLFSTAQVIDDIASVLIFGLLADFMNTWILNAGVLRWYIAKKGGRK
ncbi:protein translocase subunit SecF [Pyrococcus yayanosii]|uniref:Protein-export membrane protein SecF n=1 Tax=Pyrococcus yayanosii (strain CH1 / JCM 16557) TaxID=529709 RepID=F8AGU5_PYRYC|nr:protein translocase subunit SecF [Pyrococcus yayanosii]AEH25231.1 preprotein translocase subunit SecF [Pyrococcus yayanosii CH1]